MRSRSARMRSKTLAWTSEGRSARFTRTSTTVTPYSLLAFWAERLATASMAASRWPAMISAKFRDASSWRNSENTMSSSSNRPRCSVSAVLKNWKGSLICHRVTWSTTTRFLSRVR